MRIVLVVIIVVSIAVISSAVYYLYPWRAQDPFLAFVRDDLQLQIYHRGSPATKTALRADSPLVTAIDKVINAKRGKWRYSYQTFAPVIIVECSSFTVNIQRRRIITDGIDSSGKTRQVVSELTNEESTAIHNAVRELLNDSGKGNRSHVGEE